MMQLLFCAALLSQPAAEVPPEPVKKYLAQCAAAKAVDLPLPLPPQKDALGIFPPAKAGDGRHGKSTDVLEIVDEDEAIIRAWYADAAIGEEPTFVDLWLQGIDTSNLQAAAAARFPQVFQVVGSKLIDTTCGKRSLPLLEPIDLRPYREGRP